jgi:hypothetical protein
MVRHMAAAVAIVIMRKIFMGTPRVDATLPN